MTGYLLDTNHAGALLRQNPKMFIALRAHAADAFHVSLPSVGELWYMVHNSARVADNTLKLRTVLSSMTQLPYDESAAEEFGRVRAALRRAGRPIPPIDLQIAAVALTRGLVVLTADNHFSHVPSLATENWL